MTKALLGRLTEGLSSVYVPSALVRETSQGEKEPHGSPKLNCYGQDGAVAEWLRSGLQSRVHRFDSGPRLHPIGLARSRVSRQRLIRRSSVGRAGDC